MPLVSKGRLLEGDMGAFFGSIHVRSEDTASVRVALEALASETQRRFLMAPPIRGWITVFPNDSGQDWTVSETLASRLPANVLHCLVHDDDVFAYRLYRDGALVDEYDSAPGYFKTEGPRDQSPTGGNVDLLCTFLEKPNKLAELRSTLATACQPGEFEQFRLERFAKLLGLPNACSSYEYLQGGERDGIRGWRKFIHIPDLGGEKAARKAAAARLRAELERLKRERVLLIEEVAGKSSNRNFGLQPVWAINPAVPEALVMWGDAFDFATGRKPWMHCVPPEWTLQPTDLTASAKTHRALFSCSGRLLAVLNASGQWSVEVWDRQAGTKQAEPTFDKFISAIAFGPDESRLLAVCGDKLHSIPLVEGEPRTATSIRCRRCETLAAHPDGRWVALEHDGMLGLLDFDAPESVLLFGIGGLLDYAPVMARMFDDTALQQMTGDLAKILPPEQVEKYRQDLLRQRQHSYRGKEALTCLQFSSDGRWLICGTQEGVRVFNWDRLRSSNEAGPTPDFAAETDAKISDEEDEVGVGHKRVYAVAFDEAMQRVLFGGLGGKVRYLDLRSGLSGDLLALPDGLSVLRLGVTSDRAALILTRTPMNRDNKGVTRFQIWSYPRLCAASGIPH